MNNKEKFENFLESLKGNGQDALIEGVKKGFRACFESNNIIKKRLEFIDSLPQLSGWKSIREKLKNTSGYRYRYVNSYEPNWEANIIVNYMDWNKVEISFYFTFYGLKRTDTDVINNLKESYKDLATKLGYTLKMNTATRQFSPKVVEAELKTLASGIDDIGKLESVEMPI